MSEGFVNQIILGQIQYIISNGWTRNTVLQTRSA